MKNSPDRSHLLSQSSESLLVELLNGVAEGQPFNAAAIIDEHSTLNEMPSLLVDLAYEDYWRKVQCGCEVDVNEFVDQFPQIRERLLHMIDVGDLINQAPDVFLSLMNPEWPIVPSELGPFEILKQIGEGAFSRVYLAKDLSLAGRPVTLKITRYAVREAEALGRLQHRNIVSPLGLYEELIPGLVVLSMPFCGRATLSDFIQSCSSTRERKDLFDYHKFLREANAEFKDFSNQDLLAPRIPFPKTVAWIGAQIAEGLAHAHSNGLYHCDIKPSNILLQRTGLPLILDFNLSVSVQQHSYTGGTLTYMAPEQLHALGTTASLGGAADVYSLGATLIEIIDGQPPFGNLTSNSFEDGQIRHPLDGGEHRFTFDMPARKLIGKVFAELLEACVTLDPANRPSAQQLSDRLYQVAQARNNLVVSKNRRLILRAGLGGLAATMAGMVWTIASEPTLDQRFQMGIDAIIQKNSPRVAVRHFSRILAIDPTRKDAQVLRACALIQLQDWDVAYGELRQIRNLEENKEINALLGYVLCRWDRQNELAEHHYALAYSMGIRRLDVLNNFAVCQIRGNKLEAAKATLAQGMEAAPDSPALLFNYANAEFKLSRQLQTLPRVDAAEAMLRNITLSNDREALILAANIFWRASQTELVYRERAFECLKGVIAIGLTHDELNILQESPLNKSGSSFQQLLRSAQANQKPNHSETGIDRLLAPPLQTHLYLTQLTNSAPAISNTPVNSH